MTDESDYFRAYARDVGVNPLVGGADNVQDALVALGGAAVLAANRDIASSDTPTTITLDGSTAHVTCTTAQPPAWMDASSNIIAPGLYQLVADVTAGVAATVPGLFLQFAYAYVATLVPVDGLASADAAPGCGLFTLADDDVPYAIDLSVATPTDATATVTCSLTVIRLAS
jgi:hypothetical protein